MKRKFLAIFSGLMSINSVYGETIQFPEIDMTPSWPYAEIIFISGTNPPWPALKINTKYTIKCYSLNNSTTYNLKYLRYVNGAYSQTCKNIKVDGVIGDHQCNFDIPTNSYNNPQMTISDVILTSRTEAAKVGITMMTFEYPNESTMLHCSAFSDE
jgi:hypothetical protein